MPWREQRRVWTMSCLLLWYSKRQRNDQTVLSQDYDDPATLFRGRECQWFNIVRKPMREATAAGTMLAVVGM